MIKFTSFLTESAQKIANVLSPVLRSEIKKQNGKVYQIGGAVRDELIGKVSKDLDLLVTGIETDELETILSRHGRVDAVGKSFGILKFQPTGQEGEPLDISVPRVDVQSTGAGHKDFEVQLGKNISLEQDQLRRDFWMNAIAKDIETGEMHDIEGKGQFDIDNKQISVINPQAFDDDPLRMMRAIQFSARFGFKIEPETMNEIKKNADKINTISADRFQEEFRKMFEKGTPSIGIQLMFDTGIGKHVIPELREISPIMDKIDKGAFPAFLAVLFMSYGSRAGEVAQETMKLSNNDKNSLQAVIDMHRNMKGMKDPIFIVRFLHGKTPQDILNVDAYLSAMGTRTLSDFINEMRRRRIPTNLKELGVNGRDMMREGFKGVMIGDALRWMLEYAVKTGQTEKGMLIRKVKEHFGIKETFFYEEVKGYYAIELDPKSKDDISTQGQHEVIASSHITIAYKPSDDVGGILDSMLGRSFPIHAFMYASNDIIDAAIVDIDGLQRQEPGPAHITISHKKDVLPAKANDMVKRPDYREKMNLKLRGKLRFYQHN